MKGNRGIIIAQHLYERGCRAHPRYKAVRPPRTPCEACWTMYLAVDKYQRNALELVRPWSRLEWRIVQAAVTRLGPFPEIQHNAGPVYLQISDQTIAIVARTSRATVRRVLRRLVLAGLLSSIPPSGNRERRYRVRWSRRSRS